MIQVERAHALKRRPAGVGGMPYRGSISIVLMLAASIAGLVACCASLLVAQEPPERPALTPVHWINRAQKLVDQDDPRALASLAEAWAAAGEIDNSRSASARAEELLEMKLEALAEAAAAWNEMTDEERLSAWRRDPRRELDAMLSEWGRLTLAPIAAGDGEGVLEVLRARDAWLRRAAAHFPEATPQELHTGDAVAAYWSVKSGLRETGFAILERESMDRHRIATAARIGEALSERGAAEQAAERFQEAFDIALSRYANLKAELPEDKLTRDAQRELDNAINQVRSVAATAGQHGVPELVERLLEEDLVPVHEEKQIDLLNAALHGAAEANRWNEAARFASATIPLMKAGETPLMTLWWANAVAGLAAAGDESHDWRGQLVEFAHVAAGSRDLPQGPVRAAVVDGFIALALVERGDFNGAEALLRRVVQAGAAADVDDSAKPYLEAATRAAVRGVMAAMLWEGEPERARRLPAAVGFEGARADDTWVDHAYNPALVDSPDRFAFLLARAGDAESAVAIVERDFLKRVDIDTVAYHVAVHAKANSKPRLLERLNSPIQYRGGGEAFRSYCAIVAGLTGGAPWIE